MRFALVIPTRGDRPKFIEQCKYLISKQTLQPTEIIWVDYPAKSSEKDITQRYRKGIEEAMEKRYEFVVFWEDDDWYHPNYLQWLISKWEAADKPDFFGVSETYYYHLGTGNANHDVHKNRSSAFCTLVKLPWTIPWPQDNYPFLDLHIFKNYPGMCIPFDGHIYAIGIKHGIGLSGGSGHNSTFKFNMPDSRQWFYSRIGSDRKFYDSILDEVKSSPSKNSNSMQINNNIPKLSNGTNLIKKIIPANSRRIIRK
jgi:hypothetical protein